MDLQGFGDKKIKSIIFIRLESQKEKRERERGTKKYLKKIMAKTLQIWQKTYLQIKKT